MAHPDLLKSVPSTPTVTDEKSPATKSPDSGYGRPSRLAVWALLIGFGGFMLWSALAPLDEGVPSQGHVAIDTKRKAVQHLSGGIIKEVLVREGDQVREGQSLVKLDDASAKANLEVVRQRYLGNRAVQARLLAEQSGAPTIEFHPDLQAAAVDPLIRHQMVNQEQLLRSRRAALRADLQSIEEGIQGQKGMGESYRSMLDSRRNQLSLLNEELVNTRSLVSEGYAPRNRQLELERQSGEMKYSISELNGNIVRAERTIAELRQRAISKQQEYRKEVGTQQAEISREVLGDQEKFKALHDDMVRTDIRSPSSGQVVGLAAQTVGGVVAPGQKLMDVVPANEALVLETRVLPHLIDRLQPDMPVDVRFTSFAHSPQLVVEGKLASISGDLLTDPQTNASYYLARVVVTPDGMKKLGKRMMQPGMPVEVILKTGERPLLIYLLHPLTKRIAASMKEE